ncbi:MAG: FG-GAP-like repeat-containing protein [candidate division WOR-3 bacterium]
MIWLVSFTFSIWKSLAGDNKNQAVQVLAGGILSPTAKWRTNFGFDIVNLLWASPAICNVSNAYPENEVIIKGHISLSGNTTLYALRGTDGTILWSISFFGMDPSSPACGDLDGDGLDEIVTKTFSDGLKALDNDGTVLWTFPTTYSFSSPKIEDVVSSSPGPEVIFMDPSGGNLVLYVLSASGTPIWTANVGIAEQPAATPAISDIDGDGVKEIIIATLYSGLRVYDGQTGTLEWSYFALAINPTPSVIDLNNDGIEDILFSNSSTIMAISGTGTFMWSFNLRAHTPPSDTHVVLMEYVAPVWDINGDGFPEIWLGDGGDSSNVNSHLLRIDQNGSSASINWLYGINQWAYDGGGGLVDINNDGIWDFIKAADNGTPVWNFRFDNCGSGVIDPSVAIGDIDADNCSEVVIIGCQSSFLGGNIVAVAIDNSTPVSSCAVLSRDDELKASEMKPYEGGEFKVYTTSGRLMGTFKPGQRIKLKPGFYIVKMGTKTKGVLVK